MLINETFGPTIQGEGVHTGQRVGFIRLANCNLACSWCDTPYSWDWERYDKNLEAHDIPIQELTAIIRSWKVKRVILTGGEPLMQQPALIELVRENADILFDIETNGTIAPKEDLAVWVDMFCVSPKLAHSGDIEKKRIKQASLEAFSNLAYEGIAIFKFVIEQLSDLDEVDSVVEEYAINRSDVWIMFEGKDAETQLERMRTLSDGVIARGYNISPRLHVLTWNTRRGV
jgi:organic radical activating enzyme